jgi:hypothetical protein
MLHVYPPANGEGSQGRALQPSSVERISEICQANLRGQPPRPPHTPLLTHLSLACVRRWTSRDPLPLTRWHVSGDLTRGIRAAYFTRGIRAASAPMACIKSPDGVSSAASPRACVSLLCSCERHGVGHGVRSGAKATEGSTGRREVRD